jgi:hypothetical protein
VSESKKKIEVETATSPLQSLAVIIERRAAAYRAVAAATDELRTAASAELARLVALNAAGALNEFDSNMRSALIELRNAFDRDDRSHIESWVRAIGARITR